MVFHGWKNSCKAIDLTLETRRSIHPVVEDSIQFLVHNKCSNALSKQIKWNNPQGVFRICRRETRTTVVPVV